MATNSTSSIIDQSTDAAFRVWTKEISDNLTTVGLTNTADTGQINFTTVTRPSGGSAAGYQIWRYNDTLQTGPIATHGTIVGGSGYTAAGTYTNVPLTGGTGSGAQATIVVAGGAVTTVTITAAGTGYSSNDSLSASNANLGGAGSGFSVPVATLTTAANPIYLKIEYGASAAGTTVPQVWVTMGQGSNGSGTLTGTLSTRAAAFNAGAQASSVTSYTSRFVYNSTYGFLAVVFKLGASNSPSGANFALGGFIVGRSNDSNGNATADASFIMLNSTGATGGTTNPPCVQIWSQLTAALLPSVIDQAHCGNWGVWPLELTTSTVSGNQQVMPGLLTTPSIIFSNFFGLSIITEIALGSTFTAAIIGSTTLTYLTVGHPFGESNLVFGGGGSGVGPSTTPSIGMYILWQ